MNQKWCLHHKKICFWTILWKNFCQLIEIWIAQYSSLCISRTHHKNCFIRFFRRKQIEELHFFHRTKIGDEKNKTYNLERTNSRNNSFVIWYALLVCLYASIWYKKIPINPSSHSRYDEINMITIKISWIFFLMKLINVLDCFPSLFKHPLCWKFFWHREYDGNKKYSVKSEPHS